MVKMRRQLIVPNFVVVGQNVAETWQFFIFQDGGRRDLGLHIFEILKVGRVKRVKMCRPVKVSNFVAISHAVAKIGDFMILQMAAVRHLAFLKGQNFRFWKVKRVKMHHHAKFWQSVKPLLRCGDFSIFQDGGRRHLGFWVQKELSPGISSPGWSWKKSCKKVVVWCGVTVAVHFILI